MSKVPKILNEEEKQNVISFLLSGHFSRNISSTIKKSIRRKAKSFVVLNGNLYTDEDGLRKKFICAYEIELANNILINNHLSGHIGINSLNEHISRNYSGISFNSIKQFVGSCVNCQRETVARPSVPLTPIIPSFVRERIIVDTIDLSEYANSNDRKRYLFTFIDSFSKYAFVFPSIQRDSISVLKILKQFFYNEGSWKIFHSDNGGEFTSNRIKSFLQDLNIDDIQGAPYRPQSQGQIERFNRTIKFRIRKYLEEGNHRYIDALPKIVFQYNTSKHKSTKISPFVLFRGYYPLESDWGDLNRHFDVQQLRDQYLRYIEGYRTEYNNRMAVADINVGDLILIAKEFNPSFQTRRRPLESYYRNGVFLVATVHTAFCCVVLTKIIILIFFQFTNR